MPVGKYDAVVCILRPICVGFRWSLTRAAVFSALLSIAVAQNSQPATPSATAQTSASPEKSVAAAVRDSKTQKTAHAKKVFTEDDLDATATALPRLKMDGAENGDEIVAAIGKY